MQTVSKMLRVVGKMLLAIALGAISLVVVSVALGFLFGGLQGLFGWPTPTPTTQNLILLAIFLVGLVIYRERRAYKERQGKGQVG